jgi:large subunit ribosomal protein L25
MDKTFSLTVQPRTITGHHTKALRKSGTIPATIYGKGMQSLTVSLPTDTFAKTYKEAGETHIINVSTGEATYPVLVHSVQINPVTRAILHVEFYKVNLKEKLKAQVPVHITGQSQAVKDGKGTILTLVNEIEIEALPTDIPEFLSVDVSPLSEVNAELKVKDLPVPTGVTVLTDMELPVVKVGAVLVEVEKTPAPTTEAAESAPVPEEPAASAEKAE